MANQAVPQQPKTIIQLGRFGDLLNIFPILLEEFNHKRPANLVVAEEFIGLCQGISYANPKKFAGKVGELREAAKRTRAKFTNVFPTQTWGTDFECKHTTENFQREQWKRVGYDDRFEQVSLVIDRRDAAREKKLVDRILGMFEDQTKPLLLINAGAVSTPFHRGDRLFDLLDNAFSGEFNMLDLGSVKCERLYDLLGLMDVASCLVTVDSMPLHLANASAVPVVALVANDSWRASLRRPNHIYRANYNDVNVEEMLAAIRQTAHRNARQKIIHAYPMYAMGEEDGRRHQLAWNSWVREYGTFGGWVEFPIEYNEPGSGVRNSKTELQDTRSVPFVKDMIDVAMKQCKLATDIVLLTNSDVGFTPGVTEKLRRLCAVKGACFSYRFDFDKLERDDLTYIETVSGRHYGGLDFFAFTKEFWEQHRDKFPDSVAGSTNWDLHFRDLLKSLRAGELYGSTWHETHHSTWIKLGPKNVANAHNTTLYNAYTAAHDRTRPYGI